MPRLGPFEAWSLPLPAPAPPSRLLFVPTLSFYRPTHSSFWHLIPPVGPASIAALSASNCGMSTDSIRARSASLSRSLPAIPGSPATTPRCVSRFSFAPKAASPPNHVNGGTAASPHSWALSSAQSTPIPSWVFEADADQYASVGSASRGAGSSSRSSPPSRRPPLFTTYIPPRGLTRRAADFASLAADAAVRQCLLSRCTRVLLFARVRHGFPLPPTPVAPASRPSRSSTPASHAFSPPELGAFPSALRHRCQPGHRRPSPFAAQALLSRRFLAQGRSSLSRHLTASSFSDPPRQSFPLWGGTGGAPLPPRHPPRGFRRIAVLQHHAPHSRHRLTPACSGLALLAADARR